MSKHRPTSAERVMNTEAISPARAAGLRPKPLPTRRFDHMRFGCGDLVREIDGRHVGRVSAIIDGTVVVRWLDTGWRSDHDERDLELIRRAR